MYLPNRLELSFRFVRALPKAEGDQERVGEREIVKQPLTCKVGAALYILISD